MKKLLLISTLMAAASVCVADDITAYSIPKDHPAIAPQAQPFDVSSAPIHWTVPDGWTVLAPTFIRIGNFVIPGLNGAKAEVAVTSFPGSVGTELENVNRWRGELGLTPIGESDITSDAVTVDSLQGKLYDIYGPISRTVVVSLPRDGATWFFKLRGDAPVVTAAKPAFLDFLKSVHFDAAGTTTAAVPAAAMPQNFDPHAGLGLNSTAASSSEPQWSVPAGWTESEHGPMVLKSFSVAGEGSDHATVAISTFPGNVGGTFANVNRWRRQLSLTPVAEDDLPGITQSLDVAGGKAVVVDFTGTDTKTSKPARMVAVMVAQNGSTWFYKLVGDDSVVAREKIAFLAFVQTVRYP